MKKFLILTLIILSTSAVFAQRQFPFQKKVAYTAPDTSVVNLKLENTETVVTVNVTEATTINVLNTSRLYPGDRLTIIGVFDSIWVVTCGTRFGGYPTTFTSTGAYTHTMAFTYDGTKFYPAWGIGVNGVAFFTKAGTNLTTTDTIGEKTGNLYLSGTTSVNGTLTTVGKITSGNGVALGTNKALTGTTAMTVGDGAQTIAINSSDWDIDATGIMTGIGTIACGKISSSGGIDLGTSQSVLGTTAITIGNNGQTVAVNSSDWDISATGVVTGFGLVTIDSNLVMQNGEIISNATNGTIDIGAAAFSASLYNWVAAAGITGTADTVLINTIPDITVATGTRISFINEIANTGAAMVNVDGAGLVALEEYVAGTLNALDANDMIVGQPCEIMYNGSKWVLISSH
jgi:hypothetical protein